MGSDVALLYGPTHTIVKESPIGTNLRLLKVSKLKFKVYTYIKPFPLDHKKQMLWSLCNKPAKWLWPKFLSECPGRNLPWLCDSSAYPLIVRRQMWVVKDKRQVHIYIVRHTGKWNVHSNLINLSPSAHVFCSVVKIKIPDSINIAVPEHWILL